MPAKTKRSANNCDHFFMGNTSIIWWKIDWFVQLKKLIIAKSYSAKFTTWLIAWLITNFSSKRSQQNLDQKESERQKEIASSGVGAEKFENLVSEQGAEPLKFSQLHQPWT